MLRIEPRSESRPFGLQSLSPTPEATPQAARSACWSCHSRTSFPNDSCLLPGERLRSRPARASAYLSPFALVRDCRRRHQADKGLSRHKRLPPHSRKVIRFPGTGPLHLFHGPLVGLASPPNHSRKGKRRQVHGGNPAASPPIRKARKRPGHQLKVPVATEKPKRKGVRDEEVDDSLRCATKDQGGLWVERLQPPMANLRE